MNELITATIIANEAYIAINNYNFFFWRAQTVKPLNAD